MLTIHNLLLLYVMVNGMVLNELIKHTSINYFSKDDKFSRPSQPNPTVSPCPQRVPAQRQILQIHPFLRFVTTCFIYNFEKSI